jgi:hypothetical protein
MAFGQSGNANLNKNIQRLLDYFLEQRLAKQRYGMMGELETQRQAGEEALVNQRLAGGQALEATENKNLLGRMKQAWDYQISRDPVTNRYQSEIFIKKRAGEDTSGLEGELETKLSTDAQGLMKLFEGKLDQPSMRTIARFPDETMRSLLGEYGATTRQKEMIGKVHEPGLQLQAIGVGQRQQEIGLKGRELGLKGKEQEGKLSDQEKATISLIGDTKKFLIGEGVKPSEAGQLMREIATGRALDPLSAKNRGMALQWLNTLEFKMINKKPLTPNDERFMTTVMNTSGVEPPMDEGGIPTAVPGGRPMPGGLVSPETGLTGGEQVGAESAIQSNVENLLASQIIQMAGWGEDKRADALRLAREYLAGLK